MTSRNSSRVCFVLGVAVGQQFDVGLDAGQRRLHFVADRRDELGVALLQGLLLADVAEHGDRAVADIVRLAVGGLESLTAEARCRCGLPAASAISISSVRLEAVFDWPTFVRDRPALAADELAKHRWAVSCPASWKSDWAAAFETANSPKSFTAMTGSLRPSRICADALRALWSRTAAADFERGARMLEVAEALAVSDDRLANAARDRVPGPPGGSGGTSRWHRRQDG